MAQFDVDLFVIGGGSGGVRAARVAGEHGARVAIAEADRWGGTCVIRGCVPKKLLVYASEVSRTIEDARAQGWTIDGARHDWPALIAAKDKEIARLSGYYVHRMKKVGVELINGRARLEDPHTIVVDGRTITAANVVIATGGRPRRPPGNWITSDEAFHLPALPSRIAIAGGGYIALEFAHIFAGFGSKVTLLYRSTVLRKFDPELQQAALQGLAAHGIEALQCDTVACHDCTVTLPDRTFDVDVAMAAIGRDPATAELGLDEAGVKLDEHGHVIVDKWSRSNVPHIYAVGDVTGRVPLTPIAIREGHAVADTLFGNRPTAIEHHLIPSAVFAQPAIASVGLTEPAAVAHGHDVVVFRAKFRPMRYSLSGREERVLIKLIVDTKTDRVLGLHMAGPDAPEIVQTAAIAITMGATKADFDRTFAMHPTTAEELVLLR
ncbi:MAG: glutathione-disulfide reductase [Kofleriaceae bacterium]